MTVISETSKKSAPIQGGAVLHTTLCIDINERGSSAAKAEMLVDALICIMINFGRDFVWGRLLILHICI
jgi:hypothetical protein